MKKVLLFLSLLILFSGVVSALECGDYITEDTVLTEDLLDCSTLFGIRIGSDNIVLDCDGHSIDGSYFKNSIGIYLYLRDNVVVKNCVVKDFYYGMFINAQNASVTENNFLDNNRTGISIRGDSSGSNNHFIGFNNFERNYLYGLILGSNNSVVQGNNFLDSIYAGLNIYLGGNNMIMDNVMGYNGLYGTQVSHSIDNTFWNNSFIGNGVKGAREVSIGNNWNVSNTGNYWSDFKTNIGYPYYYQIFGIGNGIDWHPIVFDKDNDGILDEDDECPNTVEEQIIYGCSCNQILDLKPGEDTATNRDGCSQGVIDVFTDAKGWAKDLFS